jgi:hypothetical protein
MCDGVVPHLVVSGDDNDADTSTTAVLDGINDLLAGWIQHSYHSDERAVGLKQFQTEPDET